MGCPPNVKVCTASAVTTCNSGYFKLTVNSVTTC